MDALPQAEPLSRARQIRLLGAVIVAALALWLVVALLSPMFHAIAPADPPVPPGTFRPTAEQLKSLTIETVGAGPLDHVTTASGTIVADGDISTPIILPYSGQVARVLVDAGQRVSRGQPLLVVRTGDFVDARNTLLATDAALRQAQAQVANAERTAARQEQLWKTAGGAQKDYLQAMTDLAAARAQERSASAALGAARDKLAILGKSRGEIAGLESAHGLSGLSEATVYRAPIGGIIASRDVSPGQFVASGSGTSVMTITDPSRVWLVAQLAESQASAVHVGDPAEVTTPAFPGRVFHATIDSVGAALDPQTHRLPVRATIPNPDGALKPQMFASFSIHRTAAGGGVHVPATAVIHEGDSARVWVLRRDGLLASRTVRIGDEQGGQVEILSGLLAGEKVVTSGALFVNEAGLGE